MSSPLPVESLREPGLGEAVASAIAFPRRGVTEKALELLAPEPEDAVLELGLGTGRLLAALAARTRRGLVVGVDPSDWMLRHARRRCERAVREGRVVLLRGTSGDLSGLGDARFDRVVGVHIAAFFAEARVDLRELARVLRPEGRLLLGFSPAEPSGPRDPIRVDPGRLEAALRAAGFRGLRRECHDADGRRLCWLLGRGAAPARAAGALA